ncbi:MAG: hypothetical protein HQL02_09415 [Nitrospirae bacterium]|nr:hypothetical protein [Nitrospirota bacterium]
MTRDKFILIFKTVVATITAVGSFMLWFNSERINRLNDQINSITKTHEAEIAGLKLELKKKNDNCDKSDKSDGIHIGGNITQKTSGSSSPNVISGGDTVINKSNR